MTTHTTAHTPFVQSILDTELDSRSKGIPLTGRTIRLGDVGALGWNVLRGDMMLPLLTVRQERMRNNLRLMREYADFHGVSLAPHGKSSVCPQLYLEQMSVGGCWGMTAATVQQAHVVAATGIENIIIANQVVSRANVEQLAALKRTFPRANIFSLVDSPETVEQLAVYGGGTRFQILLEVGYKGGRTGVRTAEKGREVLEAIARNQAAVELCGVECYEGTINLPDPAETIAAVDVFLDFALEVFSECEKAGIFSQREELLLSAGGSAYFDRVVDRFTGANSARKRRIVLRGGSYMTYDHGFYETKLRHLDERGGLEGPHGHVTAGRDFKPALELWAAVQSLPDPGLGILTMGIRDLPYDLGYPRPLRQYRAGEKLRDLEGAEPQWRIVNSNDQHCYLQFAPGADIAVGDVIACGISHPCTAFDKWDVLYAVDEQFNVVGALKTFF